MASDDVHYDEDLPLLGNPDFFAWMEQLEAILEDFGAKHGGHPYGGRLSKTTGLMCWWEYYQEDYSPQDAFDSDRSYWEA